MALLFSLYLMAFHTCCYCRASKLGKYVGVFIWVWSLVWRSMARLNIAEHWRLLANHLTGLFTVLEETQTVNCRNFVQLEKCKLRYFEARKSWNIRLGSQCIFCSEPRSIIAHYILFLIPRPIFSLIQSLWIRQSTDLNLTKFADFQNVLST